MRIREIKVISEMNKDVFEKKVAAFLAQYSVDKMSFSTTDTKDGIMYSIMLLIIPSDYDVQV